MSIQVSQAPSRRVNGFAYEEDDGFQFTPRAPLNTRREQIPKPRQNDKTNGRYPRTSATRQSRREPTPDETQLFQSLREATLSPAKDAQQSDSTPSPPIPRTVSTDSSPAADPPSARRLSIISSSPLYPSILRQGGFDGPAGSTPDRQSSRHSSVDNASEVSWNLERDIHDDDLQRTRPGQYRAEPRGRNITAPPRRPSGIAGISIIEEEDEPDSDTRSSPERDPTPEAAPAPGPPPAASPKIAAPIPPSESPMASWTAPVRTIIPSFFRSEPRLEVPSPAPTLPKESFFNRILDTASSQQSEQEKKPQVSGKPWLLWTSAGLVLLFSAVALFVQAGLVQKVRIHWPFGRIPFEYTPNMTDSTAFLSLENQISSMNAELSSISHELVAVRSQNPPESIPTYPVDPVLPHKEIHKINFLSPTWGATIDPYNTARTAGSRYSRFQSILTNVAGIKPAFHGPYPPVQALLPWEEPEECWCHDDTSSQISIVLGRDIVPEEVVVEHIPEGETLDPGLAPQEIELWAHYRIVPVLEPIEEPEGSSWFSSLLGGSSEEKNSEPQSSSKSQAKPSSRSMKDLDDILMSSLRMSSQSEPDSAFSDDRALGPSFYRIATMKYDIHASSHIQRFAVNTIIDIPGIRVDQVVFRVKSNWGADNTCIYRLKVHGHI